MTISPEERKRRTALQNSEVMNIPNKPYAGDGGKGSHIDNNDSEYSGHGSTAGKLDQGRYGSFQYANHDLSNSGGYRNSADNTVGNGSRAGMQFQDSDDMYSMQGFNVIEYDQTAAFNMAERITVDLSRADITEGLRVDD
jgi:hypothetical protein